MKFSILTAFIKISFKASFAYRSAAVMGFIGALISVLVQMAIWAYIFRADPAMTRYMLAYVTLSQFMLQIYTNGLTREVAERISSGAFTTDLIKPANLILVYWGPAAGTTLANLLVRGLPLLLVLSPLLAGVVHADPLRLLLFACVCLLAYLTVSLIYMLTGFLAFVTTEAGWFPRILADTVSFFSGAIIPLAFFPGWLGFVTRLLPFQLMLSFPIRLLLEDLPAGEVAWDLALLAGWLVFLLVLTRLTYQRAVWRSVVQGG